MDGTRHVSRKASVKLQIFGIVFLSRCAVAIYMSVGVVGSIEQAVRPCITLLVVKHLGLFSTTTPNALGRASGKVLQHLVSR